MVVGDQGGFQLRIAAAYMSYYFDDDRLAECFNRGEDVHQFFADVYGIPRGISKNVTFGYMFGAGVNKMTATANRGNPNPIKNDVIKGALESLENNMPALPALKELFTDHASDNGGVIHDWLGQRYVVPELNSRDKGIRASGERKVFNYMIQGFEATMFRHLQNQAATVAQAYAAIPALVVHDEVGYYVPDRLVPHVIEPLGKVYTVPFSMFAPTPHDVGGLHTECSFNAADTWYDAK
jgi:DNA polymerase I-like protein with 3'-5' exonuclease and polymerase domains